MALFMYPHSITATLSAKSRNTIRRNAAILPAYSLVLGLLALLGWVAIAAGTKPIGLDGKPNDQLVIPQLFEDTFPAWFAGIAFAAIAIGALVPAAIMSIAAANTFTRNIYKEWINKDATPQQETKVSKIASLLVKAFALVFVLTMDKQNAINLQLLGGIWILQTFPSIVFSLYTRWFHRWALLAGWAVGMVYGTIAAYNVVERGDPALRGVAGRRAGLGAAGLHRHHGVRPQRRRRRGAHADLAGHEGAGRGRLDHPRRLLRRRGRPEGQAAAHGPRGRGRGSGALTLAPPVARRTTRTARTAPPDPGGAVRRR